MDTISIITTYDTGRYCNGGGGGGRHPKLPVIFRNGPYCIIEVACIELIHNTNARSIERGIASASRQT